MDIVHTREELDQLAAGYISDTLSCIDTVQEFCDSKWLLQRETELEMMRDIKDRAEKIKLTCDHIKKSEKKLEAFRQVVWSKVTQVTAESRAQELEKELESVLQSTLEGLEKLTLFLEAVEKLAVTSLSVFRKENPLCRLPKGTSAATVRSVIATARWACPLLIHFQRDAGELFLPSLVNVDALIFQLEKYMEVSQELCETLQKSCSSFCQITVKQTFYQMDNPLDFTEEAIRNMIDHLTLLNNVRLDHHFRMTFLFRGATLRFIGLFSQRSSRMRQFLEALEEGAVQLDRMKMGASISSVAGSTVGFAGGIISIVGLALAPVTAGVSLTLTLVGVGLGATSGVNGLATGIAEMSVNSHHGKKVNRILQRYKKDVATVLAFLEQAARRSESDLGPNMVDTVVGAGKMGFKIVGVSRKIDTIVDGASLALSKSARSGFIALNSIFMGLDVFFICKDSISLAKGSKSDVSKVIRGRASLWKTELDAWERIHRSLCIGIWRFRQSMEVLERPFYS